MLIAVSNAGWFDSYKEAGTLAKHLAEVSRTTSSELIREIAGTHGTGFGMRSKRRRWRPRPWRYWSRP